MKKIRIIGFGLVAIIVFAFSWYLINRYSRTTAIPFYSVDYQKDSILTVGIIGDSWVAGKKLDSLLHKDLLINGFHNRILSSGQPGAKSKLIYKNLFKENREITSSKFIVEKSPDYCIVIAGVNDAISQIGSNYYSHHMCQIVKMLLNYNIKPIIVTCPEFGIKETIDDMGILKKSRNVIAAYINNKGEIDNINAYRKNLSEVLESENLIDSTILIDFDKVCTDYKHCSELYLNSSHLSEKGNIKLTHLIVNDLIEQITVP